MSKPRESRDVNNSPEVRPDGFTTLISDFSKVLLNPKDTNHELYSGTLNGFHRRLKEVLGDQYSILEYFDINQGLLDFYFQLKNRGVRVIIYTSETIQEDPGLQPILSQVFYSNDIYSAAKLGINKADPDGYTALLAELGLNPEEVVFVDDSSANVAAAQSVGIRTVHFDSNQNSINQLNELF